MVLVSGLKDLGFRGNNCNWANNRQGQEYVVARLDHAFSNSTRLDNFEDPIVNHLPRLAFDHSLLFLSHRKSFSLKNIPFKFEEIWLTHATFSKVVETSWATSCNGTPQFILAQKLKTPKLNLKVQNKEVFGQLKYKIAEAEQFVMAMQTSFEPHPCDSFLLDLNSAKSALHNWLTAESAHWKQRAKIRWLQAGDSNTRFFHLSAKSKGIHNRIDRISVGGNIIEDEEQIRDQASIFFLNLLQSSNFIPEKVPFDMVRPSVTAEQNKLLTTIPSFA